MNGVGQSPQQKQAMAQQQQQAQQPMPMGPPPAPNLKEMQDLLNKGNMALQQFYNQNQGK